jgi:hypothetical protein
MEAQIIAWIRICSHKTKNDTIYIGKEYGAKF